MRQLSESWDSGGRFAKGRSGNPGGRPRKVPPPPPSAFDIIIDRTLTVTQGGHAREVTIDEALQQKTYQAAIAGSRMAQREIMKMIEKREKARVAKAPPRNNITVKEAPHDPVNADTALLLLGITQISEDRWQCTRLTSWIVQAALDRKRGEFSKEELDDAQRDTLSPGAIRWPRAIDT